MANKEELAEAKRQGASEERVAILEMLTSDDFVSLPVDPYGRNVSLKMLALVRVAISERDGG